MMLPANIWDEILSRIQRKVNRLSYETWFKPTTFVADDGGSVTVRVPSLLFRDWIARHYSSVIAAALEELDRSDALVSFIVGGSRDPEIEAFNVASPNAGSHSIGERFNRVDYELGAIRRDVDLILAKLSST
jgi:chromosomal replication initiation ATPase DnaA